MKEEKARRGFTIIEVALVLAIAGLIFVMVFIALPAVQRTQRDAKRRDDVGTLLTAIQKYETNNRGSLPSGEVSGIDWNSPEVQSAETGETTWAGFYKAFLGESFEDPDGFHYKLTVGNCSTSLGSECSFGNSETNNGKSLSEAGYIMYIVKSASCDGSKAVGSGNPRKLAVLYRMEGSDGAYCANTQ